MIQKEIKESTFSVCKNCSASFSGKFCNYCGQKNVAEKLGLSDLSAGITDSFNLEKGFFRTLLELLRKPDALVKNYLNGKRRCYYNPIKYYLIAVTLNVFFTSIFQNAATLAIEVMNSPIWIVFQLFLIIPLLSLFTKLFSRKYNYLEHLVVNLYGLGTTVFLSTFFLLVFEAFAFFKIENSNFQELTHYIIRIGYLSWLYAAFFKKKWFYSFLFAFFAYFSIFLALFVLVKMWLKLI